MTLLDIYNQTQKSLYSCTKHLSPSISRVAHASLNIDHQGPQEKDGDAQSYIGNILN